MSLDALDVPDTGNSVFDGSLPRWNPSLREDWEGYDLPDF